MKVVCIEEDYFSPVKIGEIYTVINIIEFGSPDETYILKEKHPDGKGEILAYSAYFITLEEWRDRQLKGIGL